MFNSTVEVRRLTPEDVNSKTVGDINHLLMKRHRKAKQVTEEILQARLRRLPIVVAMNGDDRIQGMGLVFTTHLLSYSFASIHHRMVHEGCDAIVLGKRIVDLLLTFVGEDVAFVEERVEPDDENTIAVLEAVGFRQSSKSVYRFKPPKPKLA